MSILRPLRLLAAAVLCLAAVAAAEGAGPRKRVLFISSYHPAFPSFFPQVEGIREGLEKAGFPASDTVLDIEFMDTKRFPSEIQAPHFLLNLARKLRRLAPYDVVIAGDDAAFKLAVAEQDNVFHGRPVVFLGVNDRVAARRQNDNPRVTGVVESISARATLELIERLYPLSGRILVITDETHIGELNREAVIEQAPVLRRHRLDFYSLAERTYPELYGYLRKLSRETPVLLLSAYRDRVGTAGEYLDVLARIKRAFRGAVFVTQPHGLGHGVFGGDVVDHRRQGLAAGEMAGRILAGTPASEIAVIEESPNAMIIDFAEAGRLGFGARDFPRDTVFINRPESILSRHGDVIAVALAVAAGQTGIIIMLVFNVRRRRRAETAAVEARIEAEVANKTKTEFLANMSHELRTPLNSVIGFSDVLIADRVGALGATKRAEYLSDIRESGLHLLGLLNNILDVAKIEMGRLDISEAEIDVAQVLRLCHRLVAERAAAGNIALALEVPDGLAHLRADPTRFKQSVLNLLSNAIKFSDGGGTVTTTARIEDGGDLTVAVADDGPGIPEDEMQWVMAPFNRGRSSRVAAKEGSGLGLPLTASLMASHGGRLDLESTPGAGTTATLRFPAARVIAPRRPRARIA